MEFRIETRQLGNVVVVLVPDVFEDSRVFLWRPTIEDKFRVLDLSFHFVQDNHSRSSKSVVRGLHFQWDPPMGKLMRGFLGSAFLVAVDLRKGSSSLGKWFGNEASATNTCQVSAPAGFARGFCALSDVAEIQYKCTGIYNSRAEAGILWNDPEIGIEWPISNGTLPEKHKGATTLARWLASPESEHFCLESNP